MANDKSGDADLIARLKAMDPGDLRRLIDFLTKPALTWSSTKK